MITMIDEIYDRGYQHGRAQLNSGIDRSLATISSELSKSLRALHRIEWSAPWLRRDKDVECA